MEVILQDLSLNNLQIDSYSFVVPLNNEKVILQIIVAIFAAGVPRNGTGVLLLLDE